MAASAGLATAALLAAAPVAAQAASGSESAHTAAAHDPWHTCPDGAVCVYPEGADPAGSNPTYVFKKYGAHNLRNQFGNHWVLNNQYGGATASLCKGANGVDCGRPIAAKTGVNANLTPINSITLNRP
ncbi:hypothetical protein F8568_015290 [Actinomadura sp. LD22]|uniref:Peptidase inhibitor family I36 protein n=2 Tax=Actinomadura physcomitrii TaxID=2650748 RepID=A0A6I4MBU6_9ACTN|nr:hypothetical protein [Actinomadura physcomitrii]